MPSTYSSELRLEIQATGENSGTWGTKTNTNLELLEDAIAGVVSVALPDTDYTLTALDASADEARNFILHLTGALTATRNVICPTIEKPYVVFNNTTGGQSIVIKTSAGTGITVGNGKKRLVYADGTNVVDMFTDLPSGISIGGTAISADALLLLADADVPRLGTSNIWTGPQTIHATATGGQLILTDSVTDATDKNGRLTGQQRSNANGAWTYLTGLAEAAANTLRIGGGGADDAATAIEFYTAGAVNTATGTVRGRITSAGLFDWDFGATFDGVLTALSTFELGNASDTTFARIAAGRASIEGVEIATESNTLTLTNKTLTSPVLTSPVLNGTLSGTAIATAAEIRNNTADKAIVIDDLWSSADYVTLTDGVNIAVDMNSGYNFTVTLAGNRTLDNPTNTKNGQTGTIYIIQDATGSRTLAYGTNYKFTGGTDPTLTTTANAVDALHYKVRSSTFIEATLVKGLA
jgi:hypothetical protein